MAHDDFFDTDENKALIAICARKLISNIGIGAILWGILNIVIGYVAMQTATLNVGILILGVMMLGTGVQAVTKPSLGVLLTQVIVTIALLAWNVFIAFLNFQELGAFDPRGIIFPIIIAVMFGKHYVKLGHLRETIVSVEKDKIKTTKAFCKQMAKKKLKDEPRLIKTGDGKVRAQLMDGKAFFIQRDMMRAFVAPKDAIQRAIEKPDAKALKLSFIHPVNKLVYRLDKKSSAKLKEWLAEGSADAAPPAEALA